MTRSRRPLLIFALVALLLAVAVLYVTTRFTRVEPVIGDLVLSAHQIDTHPFPVPEEAAIRVGSGRRAGTSPAPETPPRNVVLAIGDGMGIGHLSTAAALLHGPHGGLAVESAPSVALVKTHVGNELVTGSAAGATSIATGMRTDNKMVSRLPDGRDLRTLFEAVKIRGMATGVITTSGLVDATPAAFVAHADRRTEYLEILTQMLDSNTDLLIGGDWARYPKAMAKTGYLDAARTAESAAGDRFNVIRSEDQLATAELPLVALFPARPGSRLSHGPPISTSVRRALDLLSTAGSGFVLLIESEDTDEAAHENDLEYLLAAMSELDQAVGVVLEFARTRADTLVIVTADHETAGPTIIDGDFKDGIAEVRWLSDDHGANWVPLFAFGPGADRFSGVIDNTDIALIVADLLDLEPLPAIR